MKGENKKYVIYLRGSAIALILLGILLGLVQPSVAGVFVPPGTIDPTLVPKFENQLIGPPPVYEAPYVINVSQFEQQLLPPSMGLTTTVWGYGGNVKDPITGESMGYLRNTPAATFEAERGTPIEVKWVNDIDGSHMFAVDPTLHWANPNDIPMMLSAPFPVYPPGFNGEIVAGNPDGYNAQSPVPLVPHLHGGEVHSTSDGNPDAWWTFEESETGAAFSGTTFYYPNEQPAATLWYHDHALGITRINVMSGLAGLYLLRDPGDTIEPLLPGGKYEMPIAIQDRTFNLDGSLWFDTVGINPTIHPYWTPEFFGNTIMVNGMVWPNMDVDQGQYRFRLLDGSNARFYDIDFWDSATDQRLPFVQIGSDGGYLQSPVTLQKIILAPGERADVLVDFTGVVGPVVMRNKAKYPYPNGISPDPNTDGTIMQFTVTENPGFVANALPVSLNPTLPAGNFPTLAAPGAAPDTTRTLVLWEVMAALGPQEILLDGLKWDAPLSEDPVLGATEEWVIVNPTADTHPIHLHLVQFQLVSRQKIDMNKYVAEWAGINAGLSIDGTGMPPWDSEPTEVDVTPYLRGKPKGPAANEKGWHDTIQVHPGEVTVIRMKFAPIDQDYNAAYPFDARTGPGYVWHCHILDHEDNEMMRPYTVT
jgi:FtsP/CotA-like multicopper oxidase with cupredoxin domain